MLNKETIEARLKVFNQAIEATTKLDGLTEQEKEQLPAVIKLFTQTVEKWKTSTEGRTCKKGRN